jgi:hypothetical protein
MTIEFRTVTVPFEAVKDINDIRFPTTFKIGEKLAYLGLQHGRASFRIRTNGSMSYLADASSFNESTSVDSI